MTDREIISYIREHCTYDNGVLTRKDRKGSQGSYDKDGYLIMKIKGKQYKAHRLIFAYFNGYFPKEIDHINRVRDDNRIENLREATRSLNNANTVRGLGVHKDNTKRLRKVWRFRLAGETYRFYTMEDAISAKLMMGGKINEQYLQEIKRDTGGTQSTKG